MKTTYLIWKAPACDGINPDWLEISAQDFLNLVRSAEGKCRHFIKLPATDYKGKDGTIVMETTESYFTDWKRDKNHSDYLIRVGKNVKVDSYHALEAGEDDECSGEELLPDHSCDTETNCIEMFALETALASLNADEIRLIDFLYFSDSKKTVRDYEELTGIPKSTANRHKIAILKKLRKYLEG